MSRLTPEICNQALDLTRPVILKLMKTKTIKRQHLHIVVGGVTMGKLASDSYGEKKKWEYPYKKVAESKFDLTVEHGIPTRIIQQTKPEVLGKKGSTIYWGSWIDGDIVCSCSGVQPWMDEMISKIVIDIIRGLIYQVQEDQFEAQKAIGENFH